VVDGERLRDRQDPRTGNKRAEDYEPFRRFLCSTIQSRTDWRVICEIADGLEAVQRARQLQPDLVLLDIGLPTLNGIEAARQIRAVSPTSKILFVSKESSPDIVDAAVETGGHGYVNKSDAGSELTLLSKPYFWAEST
jgi:DNA-binding NarL/FixJ family response regulator